MAVLSVSPILRFFDKSGLAQPLAGGTVVVKAAGTQVNQVTYSDASGTIAVANPIQLDGNGEPETGNGGIWVTGACDFYIYDAEGNLVDSQFNVSPFTNTVPTSTPLSDTFSGNGTQTVFTLSQSIGTNSKLLSIFLATPAASFFQSFSGTGSQTVFTLNKTMGTDPNSIQVLVYNSAATDKLGYDFVAPTAYTLSGTTLTFTTAPVTGTNNIYVSQPAADSSGAAGYVDPSLYTINGATLTFATAPATGTGNVHVTAPSTLAGAAAISAASASSSATAAANSESAASASQMAAAISAATAAADVASVIDTSTTSNTIGTGNKVFTVSAGKGFAAGQIITISSGSNYMYGQVVSYSGTALSVAVAQVNGSGTFTSWNLAAAGGFSSAIQQMSYSNFISLSAGTTLTAAQASGAFVSYYGSSNATVTAPLSSTMAPNSTITFQNETNSILTMALQGSDVLFGSITGTVTSVNILGGESLTIVYQAGIDWVIVGGLASLRYSQTLKSYIPFGQITGFLPTAQYLPSNTNATLNYTPGQATDSSGSFILGSPTYTLGWSIATGNSAGGYQGGTTLPNSSTIHFFVIATPTDSVWSSTFASSNLAPTLPGTYSGGKYRRVFSMNTTSSGGLIAVNAQEASGGSAVVAYQSNPIEDIASAPTTTATLFTLTVPSGISVEPNFRTSTNTTGSIIITSPIIDPDMAPTGSSAGSTTPPGLDLYYNGSAGSTTIGFNQHRVFTNTSGQIRARSSAAGNLLYFITLGYTDARRY